MDDETRLKFKSLLGKKNRVLEDNDKNEEQKPKINHNTNNSNAIETQLDRVERNTVIDKNNILSLRFDGDDYDDNEIKQETGRKTVFNVPKLGSEFKALLREYDNNNSALIPNDNNEILNPNVSIKVKQSNDEAEEERHKRPSIKPKYNAISDRIKKMSTNCDMRSNVAAELDFKSTERKSVKELIKMNEVKARASDSGATETANENQSQSQCLNLNSQKDTKPLQKTINENYNKNIKDIKNLILKKDELKEKGIIDESGKLL
jgi:hypothetical protein